MSRAAIFTLAALLAAPAFAQPLTTAFTYQGELADGAAPANGTYDLRFALYDTAGTQLGTTLCVDNLAVVNGRFAVQLDFGAQFSGQQRFLEVLVRHDTGLGCANASGFTTLSPRAELTAAPNAAFALSAATSTQLNGQPASFYTNAANLSGTIPTSALSGSYSSAVNFSNAANQFSGSGANLTALNATNISTGIIANARTTATSTPVANTIVQRDNNLGFSCGPINATSFTGNGANLIALNAANISTGTIANARTTGLSTSSPNTLVLRDASGNFAAGAITATSFAGAGTGLTALSAANITTGILSPANGGTGANTTTASNGDVLKWNGAAWAPATDNDTNTTYAAGAGLSLSGTIFSLAQNAATNGDVLKWNGAAWMPAPDNDTSTAYSAGSGLSLSGTTFSVPASGINASLLAADASSLARVSAGALSIASGDTFATGSVTATDFNFAAPATMSYMVAPAAFTSRDGTAFNISLDQNAIFPMSNSANGIAAPINLPHGCTITAVRFYTVDNSTTANLTFSLLESQPTGTTSTTLAQSTTTGASAAIQTLTVSGLSHTVNTTTSTYLVTAAPTATWNSSTMTVKGVRIDYTIPRPAR